MSKYTITGEKLTEIESEINELEKLLTGRISEYHDIKGMQAERHAFILYRKELWGIRDLIKSSVEESKKKS